MKIILEGRNIPRNSSGDPQFCSLSNYANDGEVIDTKIPSLLDVFQPNEIVELVNRCLYQLEYQKTSHKNRSQRERDLWEPIKAALKIVHPHVSFAKATERQIEDAMVYVKENKTEAL